MKIISSIITLLLVSININAQDSLAKKEDVEEIKGALQSVTETVIDLKNTLDALKKIKISGYIQAQFQSADTAGINSYSGGNFPVNVKSRFQVRRGRVKFMYDQDITQYVLQIDVTQNGVGIKDAYATIKEPWLQTFSFTAGVFDRPFGFEISYSSNMREAPERSRLFQTLFPGERELGVKIEAAPERGVLSFLNLKAGLFNGVLPNANENDRNKDFIGRVGFLLPFRDENFEIDGGFSLYTGNVTNTSKYFYEFNGSSPIKNFKVDSSTTNAGKGFAREYYAFDTQLYYDLPIIGGLSIKGEYITGIQPATKSYNSFYYPSTTDPNPSLYQRNFNGWYINYTQNIGLSHQFVLKYDVFDPNSNVKGNDIGLPGSNLLASDIKYSTLGVGWVYHWDSNIKFLVYYDSVNNEHVNSAATGSLAKYTRDLKDNVLTARMQYRF
ncbi:MAG: porin [Bacteroidota bacterium]|nr:porin [Bacteroidota bacterium]